MRYCQICVMTWDPFARLSRVYIVASRRPGMLDARPDGGLSRGHEADGGGCKHRGPDKKPVPPDKTSCSRTKNPSYRQVQEAYSRRHGRTVKTCWIADVKRKHGKTVRQAHNRIDPAEPKYPCPDDIYPKLEKVMRDLGMICTGSR